MLDNYMQFILEEKEYKDLIHKDRIKLPIDDFCKKAAEIGRKYTISVNDFHYNPAIQEILNELDTLRIKLSL